MLHTAAYWLMLTVRDTIPKPQPLATAEFTTLRMRLLKIAARITETATRVRVAFAAACPDAALFRSIAAQLPTRRTMTRGRSSPRTPNPANPNAVQQPDRNRDETDDTPSRVRCSDSIPSINAMNRTG